MKTVGNIVTETVFHFSVCAHCICCEKVLCFRKNVSELESDKWSLSAWRNIRVNNVSVQMFSRNVSCFLVSVLVRLFFNSPFVAFLRFRLKIYLALHLNNRNFKLRRNIPIAYIISPTWIAGHKF